MKTNFKKYTFLLTVLIGWSSVLSAQPFTRDKDFSIDLDIRRGDKIQGMFQQEDVFYLYGSMISTKNINDTHAFRFFNDGTRDYSYSWYFVPGMVFRSLLY